MSDHVLRAKIKEAAASEGSAPPIPSYLGGHDGEEAPPPDDLHQLMHPEGAYPGASQVNPAQVEGTPEWEHEYMQQGQAQKAPEKAPPKSSVAPKVDPRVKQEQLLQQQRMQQMQQQGHQQSQIPPYMQEDQGPVPQMQQIDYNQGPAPSRGGISKKSAEAMRRAMQGR
jgi:hypothetical protein